MKSIRNIAAGFALAVMCFGAVAAQAANPSNFSVGKVTHPNGIVATPSVFLVSSQDTVSDGGSGKASQIFSLDNSGNVIGGGAFITITGATTTGTIQEVYMAAVPATTSGWMQFDIYACRGNNVYKLPAGGGTVTTPFATLTGASNRVHCGITFDRFGTNFGFDMIVTTEGDDGTAGNGGSIGGAIYRVTSAGGPTTIFKQLPFVAGSTSTNVAEGPQVVPTGFSGASGQLLFTMEDNPGPAGTSGTVFAMDNGGAVTSYQGMKEPESVHLVPPTVCNYGTTGGGFFTTDFFNNTIIEYPATDFSTPTNLHGNVLVPQEFTSAGNNIKMIAASDASVSDFDATDNAPPNEIVHEGSTFVECGVALMPIIKHSTDANTPAVNADFIFGLFPRANSSFPAPPADPFGYTDNTPANRGAAATTPPENNLPIDLSSGPFNAAVCELAHTAGWTFSSWTVTFTGTPTDGGTNTASSAFHPTGETTDPQIFCVNLSIHPGTTEVKLDVFDTPPPPQGGGEVCTPGYWKQTQHFGSYPAGVLPTTPLDNLGSPAVLFNTDNRKLGKPENTGIFFHSISVLQALSLKGGGLNQVARLGTAAYLDSKAINFSMSTSDVVTLVNNAFLHNDANFGGASATLSAIMASEGVTTSCPLGFDPGGVN